MINLFKRLKWRWQRSKYGVADCDTWEFNDYLCKIIPPALRKLKNGVGCPIQFYDKENTNNECERWHETLESMAQGFEAANDIDNDRFFIKKPTEKGYAYETDIEAQQNAAKKMEYGLQLFAKHFINLWD